MSHVTHRGIPPLETALSFLVLPLVQFFSIKGPKRRDLIGSTNERIVSLINIKISWQRWYGSEAQRRDLKLRHKLRPNTAKQRSWWVCLLRCYPTHEEFVTAERNEMSVTIKAYLLGKEENVKEIRRFTVDQEVSSSFEYLSKKTAEVFSNLKNSNFNLFYKGRFIKCLTCIYTHTYITSKLETLLWRPVFKIYIDIYIKQQLVHINVTSSYMYTYRIITLPCFYRWVY